MAGRSVKVIRPVPKLVVPAVEDQNTARAIDVISDAVRDVQSRAQRVVVAFDLVGGTVNRVPHGLGRAYRGYTVTPTVADATFAHAISSQTNPRKDLEVWIDAVGADQPGAIIEVF